MSRVINSPEDSAVLQENLNRLQIYVEENKLSLNVKKCYVVSFTRKTKNFINTSYTIKRKPLQREETIRDLGVIYDSKLTFNGHVETICRKGKQMLGFIMRTGKFFSNPKTFTTLYSSLQSEVTSSMRQQSGTHIQIEKVQHRFL